MNRERLLKLAEFLENDVPEDKFNMAIWVSDIHTCGSSACAFGWACRIPEFKELGLKLVERELLTDNPASLTSKLTVTEPAFQDEVGFRAAQEFFDLSRMESYWLFGAEVDDDATDDDLDDYTQEEIDRDNETPKDVAYRIRKFVKDERCSNA